MTDPLTILAAIGVTLIGGEKGLTLIKLKRKNGESNGHAKPPSLSEIQVAMQEAQFHGLSEVREVFKASQEPIIGALGEIKQVNQASLQQMTKLVTLMESGNAADRRYRAKKK